MHFLNLEIVITGGDHLFMELKVLAVLAANYIMTSVKFVVVNKKIAVPTVKILCLLGKYVTGL